jgi:hypothetical protein
MDIAKPAPQRAVKAALNFPVLVRALIWAASATVVLAIVLCGGAALSQDHHHSAKEMAGHAEFHTFYKDWKTESGVSCCSDQDCHPLDDRDLRITEKGVEVNLPDMAGEKQWSPVPPERIRPYVAPDAQSHVCHMGRFVICFVFGGAS